ncbi:GDP-L-fucose synthase [compost metagenome]
MELDRQQYQGATQDMLSHINVGTGVDCTIRELAQTLAKVTGFSGRVVFDTSKPDGAPRKLLDVQRIQSLGWKARITLEDGLRDAYRWYVENIDSVRG